MLKIIKILAFRNNSIVLKSLENVPKIIQPQRITYSVGKALLSKIENQIDEDNRDDLLADFFINKQENTGKKVTIVLQNLLEIRPKEAIDIASKYKAFYQTSWTLIHDNYTTSKDQGLDRKHLLQYPDILLDKNLLEKIQLVKSFSSYDLDTLVPLVRLPLKTLTLVSFRRAWLNRIAELRKILGISDQQACEILAAKPFLFYLKMETIKGNLKLLEEKGISKVEIINDLWVLKYSPYLIQFRLDYAIKEEMAPRTWMVRCKTEVLENHIRRANEKRGILGDNSVAKYLSERLNCSEEMAKFILNKLPALASKSLTKINKMIDFLIENGFTSEQICKMPKILLHSVETTKKRMQEIEAISTKKDYLYILTKSKTQYQQHLEALAKAHGKKLT